MGLQNWLDRGAMNLVQLIEKTALQLIDEPEFFPEWRSPLPELSPEEKALFRGGVMTA
jgi:hypothetical protein